jgi:hypothetical protein
MEYHERVLYDWKNQRGEPLKKLWAVGAFLPLLAFPPSSPACSMAGCLDQGVEMRRHFVVKVEHGDKRLPGVSVWVASTTEGRRLLSGITNKDGTVSFTDLPPGEYWLTAELLGIIAGSQCFHIGSHTTRKAKKTLSYNWGDLAPGVSEIAGQLIRQQPGQGGTPFWNQLHPVEVPIGEAALKLYDPLIGEVRSTVSDVNGHFSIRGVPEGTYVLHVDSGTTRDGRDYGSTNELIHFGGGAKYDVLLLKWKDAGGGSCGGTSVELRRTPTH